MNGIYNLYIPVCGLLIAIICNVVFFLKERAKNKETEIFSRELIYSLVDSILMVTIIYLALFKPDNIKLLEYLNKIDYAMYILFTSNLFLYVYYVTSKEDENKKVKLYNFFFWLTTAVDILLIILLLFMKVDVHINGNSLYSNGMALNSTMIGCGLYFIAIVICLILNIKKAITKKLTPLYMLIVFFVLVYALNRIDNTIVIVSAVLAFVNLIMLFTIENPDLKMIEQLNLAKDHAEKANRAKSDFLSSMSHEIRTPLNAIVGFSQCILEEDSLEAAKDDAKDIVIASQNLLEIVNGILDISKIEADKMEIVETNYNPRENFENLAKLIIPRIAEKPIELKTKFASDLPATLYGDVGKVKQIVTNILTNAAKYTEQGEINFEVNCVNENDEAKLIISIEDTGRGIKPEQIDKLFTKFQRLDEDRNTTTEGTGLGLAITKRLVEMMGGKIVVQSKYGEGSKFTVYLKQKIVSLNQAVLSTKVEDTTINSDYNNKKILIVDDNQINIKVAERLLRDYKIQVDSVLSGFECLDKINSGNTYDLILLDDMMPKMSGVETLKELKKIDGFNTPTVALTANAISGMREKYLTDGFDDYLSKPIDKNELNRVLNVFLKTADSNQSIFEPLPAEIYEINTDDGEVKDVDNDNELYQKRVEQFSSVYVNNEINEQDDSSFYHNQDYLKENGIDVNKGLELLEDIELYNDTFDNFIIEAKDRIKKLDQFKEIKDMANYAILAHATKSDAKYLGCSKLADIAYTHELKSKENNYDYIQNHYNEFVNEINKVIEIGKKYLYKS